jgi:hypothetical protein
MPQSEQNQDHPLELLKKQIGIDELISRVISKPVPQIEKELDPLLVVLLETYLRTQATAP